MTSLSRKAPFLIAALAGALALGGGAGAQGLSVRQSFRIGSGTGTLCTAEAQIQSPVFGTMFDRGYRSSAATRRSRSASSMRCVSAAAIRRPGSRPCAREGDLRRAASGRDRGARRGRDADLPAQRRRCRLSRLSRAAAGDTLYVAEGLAGYDSALQLGLRSVVADRERRGRGPIATTGAGDPAAFARVQAGSARSAARARRGLSPQQCRQLTRKRREFFAVLERARHPTRARAPRRWSTRRCRNPISAAMPRPMLCSRRRRAMAGGDPVTARRLRNYRAMHLLNQGARPRGAGRTRPADADDRRQPARARAGHRRRYRRRG